MNIMNFKKISSISFLFICCFFGCNTMKNKSIIVDGETDKRIREMCNEQYGVYEFLEIKSCKHYYRKYYNFSLCIDNKSETRSDSIVKISFQENEKIYNDEIIFPSLQFIASTNISVDVHDNYLFIGYVIGNAEKQIPFFGICFGMQMAVIEYARNVLGLKDANSTEMNRGTSHPVIDFMEEQKSITDKGGTMRLGAWKCVLKPGTLAQSIYNTDQILERHRHRYEYNSDYLQALEKGGLIASGVNPDTNLVEVVEIADHPFFVGVQYHPEYKSTVANPHPIFVRFVAATVQSKKK